MLKQKEILDLFSYYRELQILQEEIYNIPKTDKETFLEKGDEFIHLYETYKNINGFEIFKNFYEELKKILDEERNKQLAISQQQEEIKQKINGLLKYHQ